MIGFWIVEFSYLDILSGLILDFFGRADHQTEVEMMKFESLFK